MYVLICKFQLVICVIIFMNSFLIYHFLINLQRLLHPYHYSKINWRVYLWILLMNCSQFYHKTPTLEDNIWKMTLYSPWKDVFALEIKIFLFWPKLSNDLLDVLHKLFMHFVKVSLWSMVIPRSFTSLVLFIFIFCYKCDVVIVYW